MNRIVVIILLLGLFLIGSCGSNNTSNQSNNEPKCAICGKSQKEIKLKEPVRIREKRLSVFS